MERGKVLVVKRNGEQESFAAGRIALAVFRAAQARTPPIPAGEARVLGAKISQLVQEELVLGSVVRVGVEDVQDMVVRHLSEVGQVALSEAYQNYRVKRSGERGKLSQSKKIEKGFRFPLSSGKILEFSREAWALVLGKCLERGAGRELSVAQWWSMAKELVGDARTFDDFVSLQIKVLLEAAGVHEHWMATASALLLERWYVRCLGVGPLLHGEQEAARSLRSHYKAYWTGRKSSQKSAWFPSSREVDHLAKSFSVGKDHGLGFSGLHMMEEKFGHAEGGLLPQEIFANVATAICYAPSFRADGAEERLVFSVKLLNHFCSVRLIPSGSLMKQSCNAAPSLQQEVNLAIGDDLESIFLALAKTAASGKLGVSTSLDVSVLRSEGSLVGQEGQVSGGVPPVLRLFGEACGMLSGSDGERQKARISLACWHGDMETFLSYGRSSPKELRLVVTLPDAFMRRVFEGGDWILASPTDAPHLQRCKGPEFERWVREYIQMAKFSGLGKSRVVGARDVFDWICECIANTGSPSICFSDACVTYANPQAIACLSSRMSSIFPRDDLIDRTSIELGVNLDAFGGGKDWREAWLDGYDILARFASSMPSMAYALAPVGRMGRKDFVNLLVELCSSFSDWKDAPVPKNSFWALPDPWAARHLFLGHARGGYLEKDDDPDPDRDAARKFGPLSLISLSSREEYLWLANTDPLFVNHEQQRRQIRFEGVKASFGGSGDVDSLKKQAKRAAAWQKYSDGALAWDARLEELSAAEVGEAIKIAWLHGLVGVRRFVGQRVGG